MLRVEADEIRFETVNVGPNGNYVYQGRAFTGVGYTLALDGAVESEIEYRDGLQWGRTWEKYRSGQMYCEKTYFRDVLHGRATEWYDNGELAEDGEYEYGYAIWQKNWSEQGVLTKDYRIDELSPSYQGLEQLRRIYAGQV